jgi:divalent metal cation (Fe/Co/Zn/Cd) transporter
MFRTFMIILTAFGILWSGTGAFYMSIQNDLRNAFINILFCLFNMLLLTIYIHLESNNKK